MTNFLWHKGFFESLELAHSFTTCANWTDARVCLVNLMFSDPTRFLAKYIHFAGRMSFIRKYVVTCEAFSFRQSHQFIVERSRSDLSPCPCLAVRRHNIFQTRLSCSDKTKKLHKRQMHLACWSKRDQNPTIMGWCRSRIRIFAPRRQLPTPVDFFRVVRYA